MAETSGRIPKVVRGGEAAPGTGAVVPGERMELPFALECARQKVLICIAPGQSPIKGDSGKPKGVDTWVGVSMGAVKVAKEGYLPEVRSDVCTLVPSEEAVDGVQGTVASYAKGPGGHPIRWQRWGHNMGKCTLCLVQVTNLLWQGPSRNKPIQVPVDSKPFFRPDSEAFTFGPKEGPRGCRALVCPGCYVLYGPRIVLAAYPTMSADMVPKCSCSWLGTALAKCRLHEGVKLNSGIHLTKGSGFLQAGNAPVRKGAAGRGGIVFKGSMENLDSLTETSLERTLTASFPRPPVSRGERMYLNRGPDTVWVKDTEERAKLFPKYQLASEANNIKGMDLLLDCASLFRMMLAARANLVVPGLVSLPFACSWAKDGDVRDWLTTVSGELNDGGFRETLSTKLLVRNGPVVTRTGSGGEPLALGSTTRPIEGNYQYVVFSIILEVGAMPHPIKGISIDIVPGTENPVVGEIKKGSMVKPRRVHFLTETGLGTRKPPRWDLVSNFSRLAARSRSSKQ